MAYQSSINKTVLPNGVRIISERVPYVDSVSVGVWAVAGARDEDETSRGMSHFVEHMLFKGTQKRSARQIADEIDSLGGHLNAFTDKEYTCFYAKVLSEHLNDALDIVSDMVLNSVYEPAEISREINVVLEEIKRHQDTPEDEVHDLLAQTLWKGHHLGNPVVGSEAVISALNREALLSYVNEFYRPDALVIVAAGKIDHRSFVDTVALHFGSLEGKRTPRRAVDVIPNRDFRIIDKPTEQVHFCLGAVGFSQHNKKKYALAAIDSILGGGMSSRLFQEIRENRGLAYAIGSYSASYNEAGLFAVYGGTSVDNVRDVVELTRRECAAIGRNSVTEAELDRAKNQIRGALVLGQESMSNRMSRLAKGELYFGRSVRLDEVIASIMSISRDDVADVASAVFGDSRLAVAAIGPFTKHADVLEGVFS
jgi:predicted Zn-dependent peptidase